MERFTRLLSNTANAGFGIKAALLMGVAIPTMMANPAQGATCDSGALICNGGFESLSSVPGSDTVIFENWTASDPSAVRAGVGAGGTGNSAEFLFSSNTLSQGVTTGVGTTYTVTFDFKSEGGEMLNAYFGDTQIFSYVGENAVPTDWTTYSFNVQAFSGQSVLRFVAESLGSAQNIDNVVVTLCPSCTPNPAGNLGAVIDKNQVFYTTEDVAGLGTNLSGVRTLTFDGGTLRPTVAGALGQPGQPLTLALNVATSGGAIDNNGLTIALAGNIINTAAAATPFILTGSGQDTISSTITNLGTLVVATSGRTTLSGSIDNAAGTLSVRNGGQAALTGSITGGTIAVDAGQLYINSTAASTVTVGAQGTLRGNGRVTGTTTISGTLRPGNSPGTLTFTAPVTQATGSTLALEIDGTGTGNGAGNYSRVIVTGAGNSYTIGSGVTLTPVLRGITYATGETAGTNSYTLTLGQRLTGVIQAEAGVYGTFATITQPTEGLATGTRVVALYNPTSVDLYVTAASYRGVAGLTDNQVATGAAIDALEASGNASARPLLSALIPLGLDGLSAALGGISGEFNANLPLAAVDVSRGFGTMVATHQGGLHDGGTGWQAWGRAFGNRARTSDDGNNPGFRHRSAGGLAGIDYGMSNEFRVGFAVGYADSKVTGRQDSGRANIDSYYVGNYLGWGRDALFVDAQAGLTFNNYETTRAVTIGSTTRTANGETDGRSIGAGLEAGYRVDMGGTLLIPSAFLRYDDSDADAFTETGADFLNLSVDSDSHADLRGGLGLRLSHPVALDGGDMLLPELSARWEHDLSKPGYSTRQSLLGQSFTVQAAEPGRDSAVLGGGLTMALANNLRLSARYDAELSANRTQHALTAQARFAW